MAEIALLEFMLLVVLKFFFFITVAAACFGIRIFKLGGCLYLLDTLPNLNNCIFTSISLLFIHRFINLCNIICDSIILMSAKQFYLLGEDVSTAREIELPDSTDLEDLRHEIAAHYSIVDPSGKL